MLGKYDFEPVESFSRQHVRRANHYNQARTGVDYTASSAVLRITGTSLDLTPNFVSLCIVCCWLEACTVKKTVLQRGRQH